MTTTRLPAVAALVHARVVTAPTAVALRTPRSTVTYAELWERAIDTARELDRTGVHPGDIVAIRLPAGPDAITAMLGTWLAGAAFLPIDTATPDERRGYLLRHSGAVATIDAGTGPTLHGTASPSASGSGPRPEVPAPGADTEAPTGDAEAPACDAEAPAYVVYTSGSTGTPKGVLIGHEQLAGHVTAAGALFELTSDDTVLQFASIGFDVAQEEIWPTLAAGGTLAFHGGGVPDTGALATVAEQLDVTVLQLPTAYWRMVCTELDGATGPSFAGVRTVVIGSENATTDDARTHRRTPLRHTTLVNGYGPTETVITASALVLPPHAPVPGTAGLPIGGPVGERLLHVLDDNRKPVAAGESGELWIGGPLLAAGYLHDRARTGERFAADPFAADPAARMYRTGDIVLRHPDGDLEFLGRADNQVKVRGHRIELDEVDRHLLTAPGVTTAVAFTLDDGDGRRLLAAALGRTADGPDPQAVRAHLRERVPAYLIPGRIAVLDRLPLTTSGKTDRRAAASETAAVLAATAGTPEDDRALPPLDAVVRMLRGLLQDPGLGPDDDFLARGGDSLMAMRVCARMRSLGVPMRPADLLTGRTARTAVARAGERSAPLPDSGAEPAGPLDLLPAQQRWLYDGESGGGDIEFPERDHFCLNALFTTRPALGADRLRGIAESLLLRHPALRTVLHADGTAALAEPDADAAVRVVDLSGVPAERRTARLEEELAAAQRSMSLADGMAFRLLFAELGDGTARLLMTVHHFVLDGVSMGLLVDDLEALLAGDATQPPATGPRAVGTAMRTWLDSPEAREDAAEWAARTRDFAVLRPERQGDDRLPSLRTHRFRLSSDATRLVTHTLPALGIAPHDFALGALVGGLALWTGHPVHGVDVYAHSRDVSVGDLDLSRTVGYVQSTFPAVLRWEGYGLAALRTALEPLSALPERRYGFDALRYASPVAAERGALRACPRPTVRLNFRGHLLRLEQRAPGAVLRPADESFGAHRSPLQRERYLLMAEGDIVDGELEMSLKYSTGHWSDAGIEELAHAIERVMSGVLSGPDAPQDTTGDAR
ncbi:amino acid adenylation domain-containing protein [Streptomyces sp. NPDC059828]|uniref:amino acid adenylation domain-containing protein n=1 Tax=Streptomyces sp. NPDC059828 TaxID=3346965 RepID=UPI0036530CD8